MQNKWSQAAKIFFSPETFIPFIIGAIFLSVLGNAITQILVSLIGTDITAAFKIALGSVSIFTLCIWFVAKRLSSLRSPEVLNKLPPVKHQGLILLVSRLEPCQKAIEHHLPILKNCWLICSLQSLEVAKSLKSVYPNLNIAEPMVINDVYDPLEFYKCVRNIYAKLPPGWNEEDVIADFTGMTAQGSVGMVLASLSASYQFQYTPAEIVDGKPTGRSLAPIEIVLKSQPQPQPQPQPAKMVKMVKS